MSQVEEDRLNGIETVAKSESFWFELPEEKRKQMLAEAVNAAFILSQMSPAKLAQGMFRVGYYYGRKEK